MSPNANPSPIFPYSKHEVQREIPRLKSVALEHAGGKKLLINGKTERKREKKASEKKQQKKATRRKQRGKKRGMRPYT